jgi:hypothetical protein
MQELARLTSYQGNLLILFTLFRYVKGKLPQNKPSTIGVEFASKTIELRNGGGIVKA